MSGETIRERAVFFAVRGCCVCGVFFFCFPSARHLRANCFVVAKSLLTQRKRMANMEFSTSFFLIHIGALSTAGAKQQKKCGWWRGCRTVKKGCFFVKPFCAPAPTRHSQLCTSPDERSQFHRSRDTCHRHHTTVELLHHRDSRLCHGLNRRRL